MDKNGIIFVGGIHGVGKTTLCTFISEKLGIKNYSSSELISRLNSEVVNLNKTVNNISGNQDILLKAINLYLKSNETYILDGHFCLLDNNMQISEVPIDVFENIGLKYIIVLIDDASKIVERINKRDSKNYSIDFIEKFQKKEVEYAQLISRQLGIEIKVTNIAAKESLLDFIDSNI